MSTIVDVLNNVHVRFEKNTDYPASTSEDHIVRVAYSDDAISMWEKEARKGKYYKPLISQASIVAGGTGTDANESDFLEFMRAKEMPAVITDGLAQWMEVSAEDGNYQEQNNLENNIFWLEGANIRTLPAITGTITFPYIRKATRYPLGTEVTTLEIEDPMFIQEYDLAMLYLDDGNLNQYQAHMNNAQDILETMEYQTVLPKRQSSQWGMGM